MDQAIDKARRVVKAVAIRALDCERDQEQSCNIDTAIDPHYKKRKQQLCDWALIWISTLQGSAG